MAFILLTLNRLIHARSAGIFMRLHFAALLLLPGLKVSAQGNLLIMPRRVVFDGPRRVQELDLANTGKDTARYVISTMEIRMKKDGGFEQVAVPDSGQNFASNYFRFFPHSVVLGPGEAQTVKVQLIKQSQMVTGEYRSHLYFRAVPDEELLGDEKVKDTVNISVLLTPVFGISIPVIIKVGELVSAVTFSDALFEMQPGDNPLLNIVLNRTGNASVYGDFKVDLILPDGNITNVASVQGLAVYTPISSRRIKIPLDKKPGINYKKGKLHIVYTTPSDARSERIAETELVLF